jgi:hypothetical protein
MRFLQIAVSKEPGPLNPEHFAKVKQSIREAIASGSLLATGGIGKRATSAARITRKRGEVSVAFIKKHLARKRSRACRLRMAHG